MNNISIFGRLTADPDIRETSSGIKVAKFTVAVNRNKEETDFLPVSAWRERAEFCEKYLQKGMQIAVNGSLNVRNYENNDGNRRTAFEIVANNLDPVFPPKISDMVKEEKRKELTPIDNDDLPF